MMLQLDKLSIFVWGFILRKKKKVETMQFFYGQTEKKDNSEKENCIYTRYL